MHDGDYTNDGDWGVGGVLDVVVCPVIIAMIVAATVVGLRLLAGNRSDSDSSGASCALDPLESSARHGADQDGSQGLYAPVPQFAEKQELDAKGQYCMQSWSPAKYAPKIYDITIMIYADYRCPFCRQLHPEWAGTYGTVSNLPYSPGAAGPL